MYLADAPPDGNNDVRPANDHGRTAWDLLYSMRFVLLVVLSAALVIAAVFFELISADALIDVLVDTVPYVILSFLAGAYVANRVLNFLYRPRYRYILSISDNDIVSLKMIPEPIFRAFNQAGNNYVLMSPSGNVVYLANSVDLEKFVIDYGWAHMDKWELVAVNKKMFRQWKGMVVQVLLRNLEVEGFLTGKSLIKARSVLTKTLDEIEDMFGVIESDTKVKEPVAKNMGGAADAVEPDV
jgi:hypothetical protein